MNIFREAQKNRYPASRGAKGFCSGFVMLFAVTLSALLLAIAFGITNIALKEMKFSTNTRDTGNAFFAADTGIECALFYDKSAKNFFVDSNTSTTMMCNGNSINVSKPASLFWTFVVPELGSTGQSCAVVTVDKTFSLNPKYIITSKGYNVGESDCVSSNPNRVERELKVTY